MEFSTFAYFVQILEMTFNFVIELKLQDQAWIC